MRYKFGTWVYFVMITVGCDLLNSTSRINIDFEAAGLSLSSISPSSGVSSGGTSVTLRGSGFDSSASIYIGDTLCDSISLINSETLTCETPAHAIGTVDVVVLQGDDNASILEDGFTYLSTVPTITSVNPSAGALAGGNVITLAGTNFFAGATVDVGGNNCGTVIVLSTTSLTCVAPAHIAATVDVTITNTNTESATALNSYTYQAAPTVTSVLPTAGALAGATAITITGTGFVTGATATVGGNNCGSLTVVNANTITCTTSAHAAGTVDIIVTNSDTQSGTGNNLYTYQAAPTVTSVLPTGGALAGGTAITITGTGFLAGATATVGGNNCGGLNVVNANTITCTTAAHAAGTVNIVVTNADSQFESGNNLYTYRAAPTVTSVLPTAGALAGATAITITGTGFVAGASATVGGNACGGLTVVNAITITCTTAAHAAGTVDIVVTNSDTQSGTGNNLYTFQAAPTVTSVLPTSGILAGGTSITIAGTGFVAGATVTVGGSSCTSVNVASANSITCDTPAHAAGTVDIVVTNSDTQSGTGNNLFTYSSVTVTNVNPASGGTAGGTSVTIAGTGFAAGAAVTFGGAACANINVANATTITCDTPAHASGAVDVVVTNLDLTTGTGTNAFTYTGAPSYTSRFGGGRGTCFILGNGLVKCWGYNGSGQLGLGDSNNRGDELGEMGSLLPYINLGTGRTAVTLTGDYDHVCAILDNGDLKCWGDGGSGKLGYGNTAHLGNGANEMGDNLTAIDLGTGRSAVQVSAGWNHTCAVLDNGTVKCWGQNSVGQLGQGDTANRGDNANEMGDNLLAIDLGTGRTALQVETGMGHTCALLDDFSVKCWGWNNQGQLGQGDIDTRGDDPNEMGDNLLAVDLGTGRTATKLSFSWTHTCALLDNATVKCWGAGGVLGLGDVDARGDDPNEMGDNLAEVELGTGRTTIDISGNSNHICALLDNSTLKCWGDGANGVLGQGNQLDVGDDPNEMGDNLPALDFGAGRTVQTAHTAESHTCVLLDDNRVKCFGGNSNGDLGLEDTANRGDGANEMGDDLPFVDLGWPSFRFASGYHTCFIFDDGTLKCWGFNNSGQLGYGDTNNRGDGAGEMGANLPTVDLGTGRLAVAVSSNNVTTCALLENNQLKCWGGNVNGQLGQGDIASRGNDPNEMGDNLPDIDLGTGRSALQVAVGWIHVCAILDDKSLKCWGQGTFGQTGNESGDTFGEAPGEMGDNLPTVNLGTGRTAKQVEAGFGHTCAILDDDSLKCWGRNNVGQLGLEYVSFGVGNNFGDMGDNLPAVDLGTGRTPVQLALSANSTCVLLDNAQVKCFGDGSVGALGQGDANDRGGNVGDMGDNLPEIDLGTGRSAVAISASLAHVCALLDDSSMKCWGYNNTSGALGLGDMDNRGDDPNEMGDNLTALDLGTGRSVDSIVAGNEFSCALLDDATVKCWGRNDDGRLGLEDTDYRGDDPGEMGDNLPVVSLE